MKRLLIPLAALLMTASINCFAAATPRTTSPEGARIYIISPAQGAVVESPVTVKFGLAGMGVAPAGTDVANTGHHHLLVDGKMPTAMDMPLGKEVKHFGGGQTETVIILEPGEHTLQLILGDKTHVPHNPPVVSEIISVTVE